MSTVRRLCMPVAAVAVSMSPAPAQAARPVRPAAGADRSGLIRALVRQDGTSAGVTRVSISRSHPSLGVVCQRTPDSGTVSYIFKRRNRAWSYVTDSRSGMARSSLERGLERTC